jgi:hypothetical protein
MEAVEVVAKFDLEGVISPQRFTWQQVDCPVVSIGRRWEEGGSQHILVMVTGDRVFELIFQATSGKWHLRRWDATRSRA